MGWIPWWFFYPLLLVMFVGVTWLVVEYRLNRPGERQAGSVNGQQPRQPQRDPANPGITGKDAGGV